MGRRDLAEIRSSFDENRREVVFSRGLRQGFVVVLEGNPGADHGGQQNAARGGSQRVTGQGSDRQTNDHGLAADSIRSDKVIR